MKRAVLTAAVVVASAALIALSPSLAQRGSKSAPPKPPPDPKPPAAVYESGEARLGEPLARVCLAPDAPHEVYDGMDHFLIVRTAEGGEALLFLGAACAFNTLMFAESIATKHAEACMKIGDTLVVSSAYGASAECKVIRINAWHSDRAGNLKSIFDDEE